MGKKGRRQKGKNSSGRRNQQGPTSVQRQAAPPVSSSLHDGTGRPVASYVSSESTAFHSLVTDDVVQAVWARGVPNHLKSIESLQKYLIDSFIGHPMLQVFFQSLAKGLLSGSPIINDSQVALCSNHSMLCPLLIWVAQYRFLNHRMRCQLSHTMVDLVLRAGADVHSILPNKTNALFFAVKYATLETVDLLVQHGGEKLLQQRDTFGRTCLYNAMEHPNPALLRRLLVDFNLDATEMVPNEKKDGTAFAHSLLNVLIDVIISIQPPTSWVNLGEEPTDANVMESLWLLRQQGARLTPGGDTAAILGYVCSLKTDQQQQQNPKIRRPKLLQNMAKALVGTQIPTLSEEIVDEGVSEATVSQEGDGDKPKEKGANKECPLCLSECKKSVQLYCGHSFCRHCIIEWGTSNSDRRCPLCKSTLCLDLWPDAAAGRSRERCMSALLGIGNGLSCEREASKLLTNDQMEREARVQGVYSMFSSSASTRGKLEQSIIQGVEISRKPTPGGHWTQLELSNNKTLMVGETKLMASPCRGPVNIEVTVNGIPLLARISNQSLFSLVSSSAVKQLGLKRIEKLKSKQFVEAVNGRKCKNTVFTCLEPLTISLADGIDVTLHNAVEFANCPFDMMGIQLGQDFLLSGTLCVIDVEAPVEGTYMRAVSENAWIISKIPSTAESFRYYSRDGKIVELPLVHFDPFQNPTCTCISLREDVAFTECSWCCRIFPEGMLECASCAAAGGAAFYYCDDRCQRAARKVHKAIQNCPGKGETE